MPLPLGLHGQHNMFQENCIRRKNSFLLHHEHDDYTCTMYPFVIITCVALAKAGLVVGPLRPSGRPSVRPSVCPSETL